MIDRLAVYDKGVKDALLQMDKYGATRYSFPIGPRRCVLKKQCEGKRACGVWDKQIYKAATIETVIERIREVIKG